ncbi:hypothetical protein LWI28_015386 [Acer negundo]|uniref:Uncharacterized protein n=1 Tax=Acer negundo TaxID=4023 RepID=A0AAD5NJH2_ACENE|nr:hypothetical protein LWI28_015386 [Acer negundo]
MNFGSTWSTKCSSKEGVRQSTYSSTEVVAQLGARNVARRKEFDSRHVSFNGGVGSLVLDTIGHTFDEDIIIFQLLDAHSGGLQNRGCEEPEPLFRKSLDSEGSTHKRVVEESKLYDNGESLDAHGDVSILNKEEGDISRLATQLQHIIEQHNVCRVVVGPWPRSMNEEQAENDLIVGAAKIDSFFFGDLHNTGIPKDDVDYLYFGVRVVLNESVAKGRVLELKLEGRKEFSGDETNLFEEFSDRYA